MDNVLRGVCPLWATAECGENETEGDGLGGEDNRSAAEKWFGVVSFESILDTVHVVRANNAVHLLITKLPWNWHRLYTIGLFRESLVRRKGVPDPYNTYWIAVESTEKENY